MNNQIFESRSRPLHQFFSFSIPSIIGMLMTSGIVIVDGLFVGNCIGQDGLAAINLTLPVLYLFLGIAIMIGVGGAVNAGHSLGAGNLPEANRHFSLTTALAVIIMIPAAAIGLLLMPQIIRIMNPGDLLCDAVRQYLGTILWFYPAMMISIMFSIFLRSIGRPGLSLFFGLAGNALNIGLDYLMIARWQMGLEGAAMASGISVIIPLGCGVLYFCSNASVLRFSKFKWDRRQITKIFFNGSSEMIGQLSIGFTTWVFNTVILNRIGVEGVAAFTIAGYIAFVQMMIITGFATGLGPIVGFCFGAKDFTHIRRIMRIALFCGFVSGAVCWVLVLLFSTSIADSFSPENENLLQLAKTGFGIYTSAFLLNGFNMLITAYFTSIGNAKISAILALLRGILLINVFVVVLPHMFGDAGIWASYPLSELITAVIAAYFLKQETTFYDPDYPSLNTPVPACTHKQHSR